jgi:hypothetical protein
MESRNSMIGMIVVIPIIGLSASAYAADVSCQFKAQDQVDVTILIGEKTIWAGTLAKAETKTVTIPEGAFTVMSKVYNPNIERGKNFAGHPRRIFAKRPCACCTPVLFRTVSTNETLGPRNPPNLSSFYRWISNDTEVPATKVMSLAPRLVSHREPIAKFVLVQ